MKINNRTYKVEINGKEYIRGEPFMEHFLFESNHEVSSQREQGMPYVEFADLFWYNVEDCRRWFAGEI